MRTHPQSRRDFMKAALAVAPAAMSLGPDHVLAAGVDQPGRGFGIGLGAYSCGRTWAAVREGAAGPKFNDTLSFLEHAHSIGASGVQNALRPSSAEAAAAVRARAEALGMYYEGEVRLPVDAADLPRFEADLRLLSAAGATVARTAALSGRRYESFRSAAEFAEFRSASERSLALAEPVLKRCGVRLAVENHKDWLVPEFLEILRRLSSEWIGVTVDTGNNIALLEEPMMVVEGLAPFALSVHLKDMAVQETEDGFLLSEVPLGTGFLDLPRMITVLRRANPRIVFNLEMITRDPLRIPCLTPGYWATLGEMRAAQLAAALARVRALRPRVPLPRISPLPLEEQLAIEERNNRDSIHFARQRLGL